LEYSVWWICPDNSEHNLAILQLRSIVLGNAQSVKKRKEGKEKIKRERKKNKKQKIYMIFTCFLLFEGI